MSNSNTVPSAPSPAASAASNTSSSSWITYWHDAVDLLHTPSWWRQQLWALLTESLMGFLAALGLARGIGLQHVALGLGVAYLLSWITLWPLMRGSRWQAVALGGATLALGALAATLPVALLSWIMLCAAVGILLGFRDAQSVQSFLWIPVVAARRNGSPMNTMQVGQILSMILVSSLMMLSALALAHWAWWPAMLVTLAVGVGVPDVVRQRPVKRPPARRSTLRHHAHAPTLDWMVSLSSWFNAAHFLGRRLVLPAALVALAQQQGWGQHAIEIIGVVLGFLSVVSGLARTATSHLLSAKKMMVRGLQVSLAGWMVTVIGLLGMTYFPAWMAVSAIFSGWVMLEVAARFWGIGLMEMIRVTSVKGQRFARVRAHRESLGKFMRHKNRAVGAGMIVAGLATPGLGPVLVGGITMACWHVLWRGRHHVAPAPTNTTKH